MRLALALSTCVSLSLVACSHEPDNVLVTLALEVVSSIDGVASVRAVVLAEHEPVPDEAVTLTVAYTDRNGATHDIAPITGTTDTRGAFETEVTGLDWEGSGTITVALTAATDVAGQAPFAVIDRTPPVASITPPTMSRHVIRARTSWCRSTSRTRSASARCSSRPAAKLTRLRSSVVASGSADAMVEFEMQVPDNAQVGGTITLHALAGDLSGNLSAAEPVELTVDARP